MKLRKPSYRLEVEARSSSSEMKRKLRIMSLNGPAIFGLRAQVFGNFGPIVALSCSQDFHGRWQFDLITGTEAEP